MKNLFRNLYLELTRGWLERLAPAPALECALVALRLAPESREARDLIQQALNTPRHAGPASPEWAHLEGRHRQLDLMLRRDPALCSLLGWDPLPTAPAAVPAAKPEINDAELRDLLQRLDQTRRRVDELKATQRSSIARRLRALARGFGGGKAVAAVGVGHSAPEGDSMYGELGIDHQLHTLGNDLYRLGQFEKAVECYTLAIEVSPDLVEPRFNRSLAFTRLAHYGKAHADICQVIDMRPGLAEALYVRGLVQEYQGADDAAIADYEQTLKVDPTYNRATSQLAVARRKQQELASDTKTPLSTAGSPERLWLFDIADAAAAPRLLSLVPFTPNNQNATAPLGYLLTGAPRAGWWRPDGALLPEAPGDRCL